MSLNSTIPVNITTLTFPALHLKASDAGRLRGYFAKAFGVDSILFHNHTKDDGFRYGYSLIQYKVLQGLPTVVGIGEGAKLILDAFVNISELTLDNQVVRVDDKELNVNRVEAGVIDELREYQLVSPLFAFNQDNYAVFRKLSETEVLGFLNKVVTNHLVTALRGMGCEVSPDKKIMVNLRLRPRLVNLKNQKMQMYTGSFVANVALPSGIGIGKSTSKGFGTIISTKN